MERTASRFEPVTASPRRARARPSAQGPAGWSPHPRSRRCREEDRCIAAVMVAKSDQLLGHYLTECDPPGLRGAIRHCRQRCGQNRIQRSLCCKEIGAENFVCRRRRRCGPKRLLVRGHPPGRARTRPSRRSPRQTRQDGRNPGRGAIPGSATRVAGQVETVIAFQSGNTDPDSTGAAFPRHSQCPTGDLHKQDNPQPTLGEPGGSVAASPDSDRRTNPSLRPPSTRRKCPCAERNDVPV